MRTIPNLKRNLAKRTLPEFRLLLSGRVRAVRCLASGGFSHSGSGLRVAVSVLFIPQNACRKIARLKVCRTYWSACGSGFLPSIGSGLQTPCSRLLPYDLDAPTRP